MAAKSILPYSYHVVLPGVSIAYREDIMRQGIATVIISAIISAVAIHACTYVYMLFLSLVRNDNMDNVKDTRNHHTTPTETGRQIRAGTYQCCYSSSYGCGTV